MRPPFLQQVCCVRSQWCAMQVRVLDAFEDISGWTAFVSGDATLNISGDVGPRGKALRLDFDFCGGGGFVGVRKVLPLDLTESYFFNFNIRGNAPANTLEFKLADESNLNVWRYRVENFEFPALWEPCTIRNSQIEFAWGPLGGGPAGHIHAIELVIAAGRGGQGSVCIDELRFHDVTYRSEPVARASSSMPGCEPQNALDPATITSWRSSQSAEPQWLLIDFQQMREFGALALHWEDGLRARRFDVELSNDGELWETAYATAQADTDCSHVYLPATVARLVRLRLYESTEGQGFGLQRVEVEPFEVSRTLNHFFQSIARAAPLGEYPKYFTGRQSYWTLVGTGNGDGQALFNEEGLVEVDGGSFSIEPFLYMNNRLFTWADAMLNQDLVKRYLPLPSSEWRLDGLVMKVTAFASAKPGRPVLYICYQIQNTGRSSLPVRLFAAIRPFQVTPLWQKWRDFGGVTPIRELSSGGGAVRVNGSRAVVPLSPSFRFGAAAFAQGPVTRYLQAGEVPERQAVQDEFGYGSGALKFDLELAAGSAREVYLAVPMGAVEAEDPFLETLKSEHGPDSFARAIESWEALPAALELYVPLHVRRLSHTVKAAAAHIRINRDGPALHPGPRRYCRSWLRDGVIMGAALLRVGCCDALRDFIRWYARFQAGDGALPDCTDWLETEWLPEHDAYGQFIYGVMEYYRFTGDSAFVEELWPAVALTVDYMEKLRQQRLTGEYEQPDKKACYGLLPESMSHEGYMAHPVHAYWDDFWAMRGYGDAAELAGIAGRPEAAARLRQACADMSGHVLASLDATMERHGIDYLPGSVELGDFDPTSSSVAIALLDQLELLPGAAVRATFRKYFDLFLKRSGGRISWNNYTAYEVRIIGALVRLGMRSEAVELALYMLKDQRIPAWCQWPEITWRDPAGPSFLGDLPHTWISAEFILAASSLFAYERAADQSLVLAAGISPAWLTGGAVIGIENLSTYYGRLSYSLCLEDKATLCLSLTGDISMPPGGIIVKPPLPRPICRMEVNGSPVADFEADSFAFSQCPAVVVVKF